MKYNDRASLDPSQMGGGSRRRGGTVALGGGAGAIVVIVIALLFGVDPSQLLQGTSTSDPGTGRPTAFAQCTRGSDISADRDCRFVAYTNSIQDYWSDAAQDYQVNVLAHEFGHHIQKLTGTMARVQGGSQSSGPKSPGVRLELQADCYAGVWFSHATKDPDSPITEVSADDLARAVDAAAAVGDDRIQEKMQGQVNPESWTHGSAENRQKWLLRGFESGDPKDCDTFAAGALD